MEASFGKEDVKTAEDVIDVIKVAGFSRRVSKIIITVCIEANSLLTYYLEDFIRRMEQNAPSKQL